MGQELGTHPVAYLPFLTLQADCFQGPEAVAWSFPNSGALQLLLEAPEWNMFAMSADAEGEIQGLLHRQTVSQEPVPMRVSRLFQGSVVAVLEFLILVELEFPTFSFCTGPCALRSRAQQGRSVSQPDQDFGVPFLRFSSSPSVSCVTLDRSLKF